MRTSLLSLAVAVTFGFVVADASPGASQTPQKPPAAAAQADKPPAQKTAKADEDFVKTTGQSGMVEVELAKLAQQKGQNAAVKDLAQRLEKDHTQANQQLQKIASEKTIQIDSQPSKDQAALKAKLEKLEGAAFDKAFVAAMIANHRKNITAFERCAKSGADADIKAFASSTLPTLREHLKMAEDAQKALSTS
jgi:putative membrane protein